MEDEKRKFSLPRALAAEAFGTFLLTFVDAAVSIMDHRVSLGVLARSLSAATVVMTMIFLIGEVSGAHINPSVTLAFALRRVFPWKRVPLYLIVQFLGAAIAGALLYSLFGSDISFGATDPKTTQSMALVVEILLTWFLVTAVVTSSCASNLKGWAAAFPVGATLLFCGLIGKEISGASMNPARSLGTALFSHLDTYWIYVVGPGVGLLMGVVMALVLRGRPSRKEMQAAQGK